jgi:hypothetical protein
MRKTLLPLAIVLVALCGCARSYVIKQTNGTRFTVPSKPVLEGNAYHYKDRSGIERTIPAGRVSEISSASVAAEDDKVQSFKPVTQKEKHWYWPF